VTTVVVRSESGVLMEMDVPVGALACERFDQAIADGRLTIVDTPVKWVETTEGAKRLVDVEPAEVPTAPAQAPQDAGPVDAEPDAPKARGRKLAAPAADVDD
jgi:hypothetical protein